MPNCYLCLLPLTGECYAVDKKPILHWQCWLELPRCHICGRSEFKHERCIECRGAKEREGV